MANTDMNIENVTAEQLSTVMTAQRGHVQALAFARIGGNGLSTVLHNVWKTKSLERKGKLNVLLYLINNYSEDQLAAIPVVGSKKGESGNKPYDRYTTQVKSDAGMKSVPGSWYTDGVRATTEFAFLESIVSWCDGNEEVRPFDPADFDLPDTIAPKTIQAAELRADMVKAKQDMRAGLVGGCQLFLHLEEINGINPDRIKGKMPFRKDAVSEQIVLGGSNMVRLVDPMDGGEDERILSVSEFLALDPAKLAGPSKDQTLTTLMNTRARKPRGSGAGKQGKGKEDIKVPTTVDQIINLFNIGATALDNATDEGQKLEAALLARIASKGDNRKEAIKSIGAMAFAIDNLWTLVKAEYTQITSDERRAMDAKVELERKSASR